MKKIKWIVVLSIVSILFGLKIVKASDDGTYEIVDETSFDECLIVESSCRFMANITVQNAKTITHDMILDLNGYYLTPDSSLQLKSGLISVERGAKLTINDSKGTGKISSGESGNVYGGIQLIKESSGNALAELEVNNGTIEGYYYGIVGNGSVHNTKITINGGNITGLNKEDSLGIFHPQKGEVTINGGSISGGTGIEMRSGTLTVNKGSITGVASKFIKMVNRSGSTANGVGIAVAQHTTQNPININIYNGNIEGQYAFYEWNPHENPTTAINQIQMHIYGGNFTGLASGVSTVFSEDFKKFISGGKFNKDVTEYLTDDANVSGTVTENTAAVFKNEEKKSNKLLFPLLLIVLLTGLTIIYYAWKNGKINLKRIIR